MQRIWQKYYVDGVPYDFHQERITLEQALKRSASLYPDKQALIFQGTSVTFRELDEMISRFASALRGLEIQPGARVSIVLPNLIQTVVSIYGALRAGAIPVMHNPRYHYLTLEKHFKDADSEVLICLDVLIPTLIRSLSKTNVREIVSCHIRDFLPFVARKLFPLVKRKLHRKTTNEPNVHEFMDLLDTRGRTLDTMEPDMEDTAFILFTSATTGVSKGVELSHANMSANVQQVRSWFPQFSDGNETLVGCLPFFHIFGLTCALNVGLLHGFTNVLVPLPEPRNIIKAIETGKATFLPALPAFYNAVINDRKLQKQSLRFLKACFSGASPLPREIIRQFESLTGSQICEGYGLTESSPTTHINPLGGIRKPGTIGLPLPGTDAKIVDPENHAQEITQPDKLGELCVKGPQIMKGYLNLPADTAAVIKDGWLLTGDIVSMDGHGYFSVFDRKKDIIRSPVGTIYPREIEEVIFTHPKVLDAGVIGVTDERDAELVKGYIVLKKGEQATQQEMIDHCKKYLKDHQIPFQIDFIDEMPRSLVGKTLRKELRRLHLIASYEGRKNNDTSEMRRDNVNDGKSQGDEIIATYATSE